MSKEDKDLSKILEEIKKHKNHSLTSFSGRKQSIKNKSELSDDLKPVGKLLNSEEKMNYISKLLRMGFDKKYISKFLGLSYSTVRRYAKRIRQEKRQLVIRQDKWDLLGDAVSFFEEIEQKSLREASASSNPSHAIGFINAALKARVERVKLELETGLIDRQANRREISVEINGTKIDQLSTEELIEHKNMLASKLGKSKEIEGFLLENGELDAETGKR